MVHGNEEQDRVVCHQQSYVGRLRHKYVASIWSRVEEEDLGNPKQYAPEVNHLP